MALQDIINWAFSIEVKALQFLTDTLHIPIYLIKLAAIFGVTLLICLMIWKFSGQLARKDLFTLNLKKEEGKASSKGKDIALYVLEYLIIFPLYTVLWGGIFVLFLTLLVSEGNYSNVVFFSTIIIAIIRSMAYFDEKFARDLALTLPLVLLVTILLNPQVLAKVTYTINIVHLFQNSSVYLSVGFIVFLEWTLRAINSIRNAYKKEKAES